LLARAITDVHAFSFSRWWRVDFRKLVLHVIGFVIGPAAGPATPFVDAGKESEAVVDSEMEHQCFAVVMGERSDKID